MANQSVINAAKYFTDLIDLIGGTDTFLFPISGRSYYVSAYGDNDGGLSWEHAFTTIAAAIAASNTYIALATHNYGRNRIFVDGNYSGWVEALVTLPQQCDIIGVGLAIPTVYKSINITSNTPSCHIYNMCFMGTTAASPIVRISGACDGLEFHNCVFQAIASSTTIGLQLASEPYFKIDHCRFYGQPVMAIGIQVDGPNLAISEITNNLIFATDTGIKIMEGVSACYQTLIKDNVIGNAYGGVSGATHLAIGIDILDTGDRVKALIIHNYISAVDAIHYAVDSDYNKGNCIANEVVEGVVANQYTKYS